MPSAAIPPKLPMPGQFYTLATLLATIVLGTSGFGTVVTTLNDEEDGLLGGGGGISLREAIKYSAADTTITFDPALDGQSIALGWANGAPDLVRGAMVIDKSLTIDASALPNGITIDGGISDRFHQDRILHITPGHTVTLHGLTMTGGEAFGNGGAILSEGSTLTLAECILRSNDGRDGGAIFSDGQNGIAVLTLRDCTLEENEATLRGGAIYSSAWQNGNATLILSNCSLSNNISHLNAFGGAIYSDARSGGAASVDLSSCTLIGNFAANGGAIDSDGSDGGNAELVLSDCILESNAAGNAGGAIFSYGFRGNARLQMNDCLLKDNTAGSGGGAVFSSGGGIDGDAVITLINCTLDGNSTDRSSGTTTDSKGGGMCIWSSNEGKSTTSLTNCTFTDNNAANQGGGLYSDCSENGTATLILSNCTFKGNSSERAGGGIFSDASDGGNAQLQLDNCSLIGNSTTYRFTHLADGGGVFSKSTNMGSATLTLHDCTLSDNTAQQHGGAIYADGSNNGSSRLDFISCVFEQNTGTSGGAIHSRAFESGNITMALEQCTLAGNFARTDGGGISISTSGGTSNTASLSNCTLTGNRSNSSGGGIFSGGDITLNLNACTLTENSSNHFGGGFSGSFTSSTLTLHDSIVAANRSETGPDIYNAHPTTTVSGVNMIGDLADSNLSAGDGSIMVNPTPMLAPLGDYGGPTPTMIPMPGSPVINTATGSARTQDQRGISITDGAPDIGATEFRPIEDVPLLYPSDGDLDGIPYGLELALGTDPLVAEFNNPRHLLASFSANGSHILQFGKSNTLPAATHIRVMRSTTLLEGSFAEVASFNTTTSTFTTNEAGDTFTEQGPPTDLRFEFLDSSAPFGEVFYRLEADPIAP